MAICLTSPRTHSSPEFGKLRSTNITIRKLHLNLAFNSKLRFPYSISVPNVQSRKYSHFSESSSVKGGGVSPEAYQDDDDDGLQIGDSNFDKLKEWVNIVRPFIPGGSWWNLYNAEGKQDGSPTSANPVSLPYALARMWTLVADQRWVLCTAFAALAIAAVGSFSLVKLALFLPFRPECFKSTFNIEREREKVAPLIPWLLAIYAHYCIMRHFYCSGSGDLNTKYIGCINLRCTQW